ncbi:hypothetical protein ACT3CD_14830 [Geofilum sp. OHC36d9]|uniref:hypothetical protein n=1 Tax=Geofilum sp. OHC36d9 TaxID=3458413 RepID=UPI004033FB77
MRFYFYLILILLIFTSSCKNRSERLSNSETKKQTENQIGFVKNASNASMERNVEKAVFYLENSGSMFGYVNGFTEYVDVVSELAEKPRFAEENTKREFYFVNGGQKIKITNIGNNPAYLKDKLNLTGFNCGDVTKSNLNLMFQLALSRAKNDTVSILISDAIYDIGKPQAPMNALSTEGRETRSRFIERLNTGDLQTIIIKLKSHFDGKYFPVTGGVKILSQDRPFYVWIFGETELLNEYFNDDYIKSLKGFSDVARFLKNSELEVPYQAVAHNKVGDFRFDKRDRNKLVSVKSDRKGQGFHFTLATDYSALPFSDSYLTSVDNYICDNSNFSIKAVSEIGDIKLFGLNFTPTHLITVGTERSPLCQLEISLKNTIPNWIVETNSDDESDIVGDTSHTFGFKFLINAISEAYQYKNQESNIVTFKFELIK